MNELLENNQNLDLNFYKDQIFSAVHIGDFVLDDDTKKVSPLPKICVVMPVYNTKPSYIRSAVESVTSKQSYQVLENPVTHKNAVRIPQNLDLQHSSRRYRKTLRRAHRLRPRRYPRRKKR